MSEPFKTSWVALGVLLNWIRTGKRSFVVKCLLVGDEDHG